MHKLASKAGTRRGERLRGVLSSGPTVEAVTLILLLFEGLLEQVVKLEGND